MTLTWSDEHGVLRVRLRGGARAAVLSGVHTSPDLSPPGPPARGPRFAGARPLGLQPFDLSYPHPTARVNHPTGPDGGS